MVTCKIYFHRNEWAIPLLCVCNCLLKVIKIMQTVLLGPCMAFYTHMYSLDFAVFKNICDTILKEIQLLKNVVSLPKGDLSLNLFFGNLDL